MCEQFDFIYQQELQRMKRFCALQERPKSEVRKRLYEKGIYKDKAEAIIQQLVDEEFINEQRFAEAFVRGKFRINKWGRVKIVNYLKVMQVSGDLITKGLEEINEEEYICLLRTLIEKKKKEIKTDDPLLAKQKLINYLMNKGFEGELIFSILKEK